MAIIAESMTRRVGLSCFGPGALKALLCTNASWSAAEVPVPICSVFILVIGAKSVPWIRMANERPKIELVALVARAAVFSLSPLLLSKDSEEPRSLTRYTLYLYNGCRPLVGDCSASPSNLQSEDFPSTSSAHSYSATC